MYYIIKLNKKKRVIMEIYIVFAERNIRNVCKQYTYTKPQVF